MSAKKLSVPLDEKAVRKLQVGDTVHLSGVAFTARDAAHKYLIETFIKQECPASERPLYELLKRDLDGGVIYHCGPVVRKREDGLWQFVAAGPTTSVREEPYEAAVIEHFNVRAIIGKGGMGPRTLAACQKFGAVYLHAIGGAATLIAERVPEVLAVHKLDFGVPEAMWQVLMADFPCVVTMDAHGRSLHEQVQKESQARLAKLLAKT